MYNNRYDHVKLKWCLTLSSSYYKALSPLAATVVGNGDKCRRIRQRQYGQGLSRLGVVFVPSGVDFADLSHSQVYWYDVNCMQFVLQPDAIQF